MDKEDIHFSKKSKMATNPKNFFLLMRFLEVHFSRGCYKRQLVKIW